MAETHSESFPAASATPQAWIIVGSNVIRGKTTAIVMMMSMIALFTQEMMSIFELYYVPMLFLSGQLFPVSLLPGWASTIAKWFPFYYTTGAPTEILIGRVAGSEIWRVLGMQAGWILFAFFMAKVLWSRGLRYYTGVGM